MSDFKAELQKIRFPMGLRPIPRWTSLYSLTLVRQNPFPSPSLPAFLPLALPDHSASVEVCPSVGSTGPKKTLKFRYKKIFILLIKTQD